jgi:hypothetical protein
MEADFEIDSVSGNGSASHRLPPSRRVDPNTNARRGSTGSAKIDDESARDLRGKNQTQKWNHSDANPKLKLQTEELETSGMSEMEIADLARKRASEQPNSTNNNSNGFSRPKSKSSSYASVVKESTPSGEGNDSIPESVLSRQAAEAIELDHHQREIERQMEIEQVRNKEDLLVPPARIETKITTVIERKSDQKGQGRGENRKDEFEDETEEIGEKKPGSSTLEMIGEEASHLKSTLSNAIENLSSSVSSNSSPLQKGRETITNALSSVGETVKSKFQTPLFGRSEELKNRSAAVKDQIADQAVGVKNRIPELKEEAMKKASDSIEQGKKMWDQGKQIASNKLEEGKQIASNKLEEGKQLVGQKLKQAKEMLPQSSQTTGMEKGHQIKSTRHEVINKREKHQYQPNENQNTKGKTSGSSSPSSLSSNWRDVLSSITNRASDLKQQAAESASQLGTKLPDVSNYTSKLSDLKSSGLESLESGKQQLNQVKQRLPSIPSTDQAWEVIGKGKEKLNELSSQGKEKLSELSSQGKEKLSELSNQAAENLDHWKEEGLAAAESSGLVDHDRHLTLRQSLHTLSRKFQRQSQFQSFSKSISPYLSRLRSFGSNYVSSYQDFLSDLRDQNYFLQMVVGLMAVMHVFIPLLFLDYPQARMSIKWYSFVAIFSHALWYVTNSMKLIQLPNVLLAPLCTYLFMLSPIIGEGINAGPQSLLGFFSGWLSIFAIPFQARSYFFTLWIRALLILDTAVLTTNWLSLQSFMAKNGGSIKKSLQAFLRTEEGTKIKKKIKKIKKLKDEMQGGEEAETQHQDEMEEEENERSQDEFHPQPKKQQMSNAIKSSPSPSASPNAKVSASKPKKKSSFVKPSKPTEHDKPQEEDHPSDWTFFKEEQDKHPHRQQQQRQAPATKMKMKNKKSAPSHPHESEQQFEAQPQSPSESFEPKQSKSKVQLNSKSPPSMRDSKPQNFSASKESNKKFRSVSNGPVDSEDDDRDRYEQDHRGERQLYERPDLLRWDEDPAPYAKQDQFNNKNRLHQDHNAEWSSGNGMTLSGEAATMAMQDWSMAK